MKKLCLYTLLILCAISGFANLVTNKPITIKQPDGSSYPAFVSGDEYYHRVHDKDGYTILQNSRTGFAVYAIPEGNRLKASDSQVGKVDPVTLGISDGLIDRDPAIETRFQEQQQLLRNGNRAQSIGQVNNVVVYVRFADQLEFANLSYTWYDNLFNSTNSRSLHGLYDEQSNGQLNITTYLYPGQDANGFVVSLQLPQNRGYFCEFNPVSNPDGYGDNDTKNIRMRLLAMELSILAGTYIPGNLNIDTDNDGVVDALTFLFRGESDDWGHILWPAHHTWTESIGSINGKDVTHYVMNFELDPGLSSICHEMGHMIGAPDYYHYGSAYMGSHEPWTSISPAGGWDLMCNDNAQFWSVHTKWKYGGWFSNIPTLVPTDHPVTYTLQAIDESPFSCYKIASTNPDQYYLLEYRRKAGDYDTGLPGEGLVVWRVISNLEGNSAGPPDELYVYRPGGIINTNGVIAEAALNFGEGRTQIHNYSDPKPWLYADSLSTNNGNLVITDVGPAGGSNISFTLRSTIPKYWKGTISNDWNNSANWKNGVPGVNDDAIIPAQCPHYPRVTDTSTCRNLTVDENSQIYIGTGSLTIHEDMINRGGLFMTEDGGSLTVLGSMQQETTSTATINANVMIYIQGNLECRSNTNFYMQQGTLEFIGGLSSYIVALRPIYLHNLLNDKMGGTLSFGLASVFDLVIFGNFTNMEGCEFRFDALRKLELYGNYASYGHAVWSSLSTLKLVGQNGQTLRDNDPNGNLGNLVVEMGASNGIVNLLTGVRISGDINIVTGTVVLNGYEVKVHGDWRRETGTTGFIPGNGTVTFSGSEDQTCFGEEFYILKLDKSSGKLIIPQNTNTECAHYDWEQGTYLVDGGSFTALDLVDNGVLGDIILSSGTIFYTQEHSASIGLRGDVTILSGSFVINGGANPCEFAEGGGSSLTMEGGTLDIADAGIRISDALTFSENITGGTIRTSQGVEILRADFIPVGSVLELYGLADCTLSVAEGSSLHHLLVNKVVERVTLGTAKRITDRMIIEESGISRSGGVTALGTLQLNGDFRLQGGTFTAPSMMKVKGDWINDLGSTAFEENSGSVEFNGLFDQNCNSETFKSLYINKPVGRLLISAYSNVTCQTYICYAGTIEVISGSFTANDLGQNGIYGNFIANSGCTIDLHQDAAHRIDLNGSLTIHLGGVSIHGGSADSRLGYVNDASISMDGGYLNFLDHGLQIEDWGNIIDFDVTGGTLQIHGGFTDNSGWVHFAGGTLSMVGTGNVPLMLGSGSNLWHLDINKASSTDTVVTDGSLLINGALTIISGSMDISTCYVTVWSDLNVHGTLRMFDSGSLYISGNINWFNYSVAEINAGNISCGGDWLFDETCQANLTGSSTMFVSRYGGTITNRSVSSAFGSLLVYGLGMNPVLQYHAQAPEDSLRIYGSLVLNNTNTMNLSGANAIVSGVCTLNNSSVLLLGAGAVLTLTNDLIQRGRLEIGDATVSVSGTYTSYDSATTNLAGGTFLHSAPYSGTPLEIRGAITMTAGTMQFTHSSIIFRSNSTRIFSGGILRVGGGLVADEAGSFSQSGGKVEFIGTTSGTISLGGGGYFNEVFIDRQSMGILTLNSTIEIHGNFTLHNGYLNSNSFNISLYGLWLNEMGPSFFNEGTGTVSFVGSQLLTGVISDETFYNLSLNNAAEFFYNFRLLTSKNLTIINDLRLLDGTFNLQTSSSISVGNDIIISAGAGLNAYYAGNCTITVTRNITDSNTATTDATGVNLGLNTLVFTGAPVSNVVLSQTSLELGFLTINKSLSSEVHFNKPVKVNMNCLITRGLWYDSVNGLTHEFRGNLTVNSSGNFYTSNLNTLAFKGDSQQVFIYSGSNAINALTVDKSPGSTLSLGSNLISFNSGVLTITSGTLDLGQYYYRVTGNVIINNHGKLRIGQDGRIEIANAKALTVNSGGILELRGTSGHNAKVTRQSGNYSLNLESGSTISAEYATFEYMDLQGLNLKSGAFVDENYSLNNCTFQFGKASGALITANNSQHLTILNATFPTNSWNGLFNIKKTVDSGSISFFGATGSFSGATSESDQYNRIHWLSASPDLKITQLTVSDPDPYLCDAITISVTIRNNSDASVNNPFRLDLFKNSSGPPEEDSVGDIYMQIPSLAGNTQSTFTFTNVSTDTPGLWTCYARVDSDAQVAEALESNNLSTASFISWHSLPEVESPLVTLSDGYIRLSWSYPIAVYRYKIFKDANPDGDFSILAGTSDITQFCEAITSSKCFYKVRAERLLP